MQVRTALTYAIQVIEKGYWRKALNNLKIFVYYEFYDNVGSIHIPVE